MARKRSKPQDRYSKVWRETERFMNSPLKELAQQLLDFLDIFNLPGVQKDKRLDAVEYVSNLLKRLPNNFDDRYYFDNHITNSIVDIWCQGDVECSELIVPSYYTEWGHEPVELVQINPTDAQHLHLIYFKRKDEDDLIDLLDYPWLCHELGHYLLSQYVKPLEEAFLPHINNILVGLKKGAIADRGLAKVRAENTIKDIEKHWRSSKWLVEITMDVIAVWTCGPAYLASYEEGHEDLDPFVIEQEHPPVELRIHSLVNVAQRLSWQEYLKPLEELQQRWLQSGPIDSIRNRYYSLRKEELIDGCLEAALKYCRSMQLPRLTQEEIDRIGRIIEDGEDLTDGIDLIVGAWLVYQQKGPDVYAKWERRVVSNLMEQVIP